MIDAAMLEAAVVDNVTAMLAEDVRDGDVTAQLIPADSKSHARIVAREPAVVCGAMWVEEIFRQLGGGVTLRWLAHDGQAVSANDCILELEGNSRVLLTAERSVLNVLQTLSATATACQELATLVAATSVKLLDTRKTLPGLRVAQKYAVAVGGCFNHRLGLYDAFLIKENHINALGSIGAAVDAARRLAPGKPIEVEVENLAELAEALAVKPDTIMLDNFSLEDMAIAVEQAAGIAKLEASGGINKGTLLPIAQTGVDYISIGALTKDCKAIDLSMRFA